MTRCKPRSMIWSHVNKFLQSKITHSSIHKQNHHLRSPYSYFTTFHSEDTHQLYLKQIQELEQERFQLFGDIGQDGPFSPNTSISSLTEEEEERRKEELETRFHFTPEDYQAWTNVQEKQGVYRKSQDLNQDLNDTPSLTHWDESKKHVTMVDVSSKHATVRQAVAQSIVVLPVEVLKVLVSDGNKEIHGPKGPIFETARIAGIMAANDLIPLCHPLFLEAVNIDIQLQGNQIIIKCDCSVTHKTGVEMEALMGASITALTIYDMLKALSHQVIIKETKLLQKSGGKRHVLINP